MTDPHHSPYIFAQPYLHCHKTITLGHQNCISQSKQIINKSHKLHSRLSLGTKCWF